MRPLLHLIKTENDGKIETFCGRTAEAFLSVFAEANGNCIVCTRLGDDEKPSCAECARGGDKKRSDV